MKGHLKTSTNHKYYGKDKAICFKLPSHLSCMHIQEFCNHEDKLGILKSEERDKE
jgi:hypothetical protein